MRVLSLALGLCLASPAVHAAARELGQEELRAAVAGGQGQSLSAVLRRVGPRIDGKTVDVRAFDSDGLIYGLMVMLADGSLGMVYVDARTGRFLAPGDGRVQAVRSLTRKTRGRNLSAGSTRIRSAGADARRGTSAAGPGDSGKADDDDDDNGRDRDEDDDDDGDKGGGRKGDRPKSRR